MRGFRNALVLLLAASPAVLSAPPAPPVDDSHAKAGSAGAPPKAKAEAVSIKLSAPKSVEVGKRCVITAETKAAKITWEVPAGVDALQLDGKRLAVWAPPGTYEFRAFVPSGEDVASARVVLTVTGAAPGPAPGPKPKPDPPTPAPEGFRVIFVYETSQALTPAMQQVMFGEKVRAYLDAKSKGWRRFDKDVDAANEKDAEIKALWQAARPKVTAVPCVIVAAGAKAEILPLPATEAEALQLFAKYGG